MTALRKSVQIAAKLAVPNADRSHSTLVVHGDFLIPTGFAINNVVEMVPLPAGMVLTSLTVDNASLGGTMTANIGILTGLYDAAFLADGTTLRTCGAEYISAAPLQTASLLRNSQVGSTRVAAVTDDGLGNQFNRSIGFVCTAATSPTVGAAIRFTATMRHTVNGT